MDAYSPEDSFLINSLPLNANQFEAGSEALNSVPSILVWNTELNVLQRINTKTNEVLNQFNSAPSVAPYKVYTALLSQSGVAAPTVVILQNTIGNIVWTRGGVGSYSGVLAGAFPDDKTFIPIYDNAAVKIPISTDEADLGYYLLYKEDGIEDQVSIDVIDETFTRVDLSTLLGNGGKILVEIKVYP